MIQHVVLFIRCICLFYCFYLLFSRCSGRLDSTNILHSSLSIITSIGLEHTQWLGNTVEEITREKAGIIKEGIPVIVGKTVVHQVTKEIAEKHHAPHIIVDGEFQNFDQENSKVSQKCY